MRPLLIALVGLALVGCAANTNIPQLPASFVSRTDDLAKQYIKALASRDRQQLIALGRSPDEAVGDLAGVPGLVNPAKPRYLLDMLVADSYARQYAVALAAGGEMEIRCWFQGGSASDPHIKGYQLLSGAQ